MGRENRFRLLTRINQAFCPGRGRENWKMGRENSFRLMSWINQAFCTGRGGENWQDGQRKQVSATVLDISGILSRSWRRKLENGQRKQVTATDLDICGILYRSWQRKLARWAEKTVFGYCPGYIRHFVQVVAEKTGKMGRENSFRLLSWTYEAFCTGRGRENWENGQREQFSANVLDISGILSRSWQRKQGKWAERTCENWWKGQIEQKRAGKFKKIFQLAILSSRNY